MADWRTYRQALRDIPQVAEYTEPTDVKFPISPEDYKKFYAPVKPEEAYLATDDQKLKLAGYFTMHFKERMIQYLLIKQGIAGPLNYKNYRDQMAALPVFKAPELSEAEMKKLINHLPDDRTGDPATDSDKFVDSMLLALSESTEISE